MPIKESKPWKFFSSIKLAIWLLAIIAILSLVGTFIPQKEEPALYISKFGSVGYQALVKIGLTDIYASWWFVLFLILLSINLAVCLINRFSLKIRALGTMLSHLSVLVILLGAVIGFVYGQKGFIRIGKGEEISSFVAQNGREVNLGFSVRLNQFIYSENIDPKEKLLVYPCPKDEFCGLQHGVVGEETKEKGPSLAEISAEVGTQSAIADTGYSIKVLRYLPDFVMDTATKVAVSRSPSPNNPAIEVELKDKDGNAKVFWVFARFPDMHQEQGADFKFVYKWAGRRPKDFISKVSVLKDGNEVLNKDIRVNDPLVFGGYAFFQSSYDTQGLNWSGLQVVKDPGVPVVYAGFGLLILGLMIIFYINPLIQRR